MEAEVSIKTQKKARSLRLTPEQLAFADLVAVGWPPEDAWAVAMRIGATWEKRALKEEREGLLQKEGVVARIDEVKSELSKKQAEEIKEIVKTDRKGILERATDKTHKIIELQALIEGGKLRPGSIEYNKINDQIIQITQMKKEDLRTEDNTKHFFLPVNYPTKCEDCLIYLNNKGYRKKKANNDS